MIKLYTKSKAQEIINKYSLWIDTISNRYSVPAAVIKAILFMEMIHMDVLDIGADLAVQTDLFDKKDSSTGIGQIFGYVGLEAIIFAINNNITDIETLGLDHMPDINNPNDIKYIWNKLQDDKTNIEVVTLNILYCAKQITGNISFNNLEEDTLKLIFTRYNQDTRHITPYGIETYNYYLEYLNS